MYSEIRCIQKNLFEYTFLLVLPYSKISKIYYGGEVVYPVILYLYKFIDSSTRYFGHWRIYKKTKLDAMRSA